MHCPHCGAEHSIGEHVCPALDVPVAPAPEADGSPVLPPDQATGQATAPTPTGLEVTPGRPPAAGIEAFEPRSVAEPPPPEVPLLLDTDRFNVPGPPAPRPAVVGAITPAGRRRRAPPPRSWAIGLAFVLAGAAAVALWVVLRSGASLPGTPAQDAAAPSVAPAPTPEAIAAGPDFVPDYQPLAIVLDVTPAKAAVTLDGKPIRGRRFEIPRDGQTHTLTVSAPGHVTYAKAFLARWPQRFKIALRPTGRR